MNVAVALACGFVIGCCMILADIVTADDVLSSVVLPRELGYSIEVIAGVALVAGIIGFAITKARTKSKLGAPSFLSAPQSRERRLIFGSFLSGIGWGLFGIFLSSAVNLLGIDVYQALLFMLAVLVGIALVEIVDRW